MVLRHIKGEELFIPIKDWLSVSYVALKRGRKQSLSLDVIDYQSIKTALGGVESRGVDGGKKIKGRPSYNNR